MKSWDIQPQSQFRVTQLACNKQEMFCERPCRFSFMVCIVSCSTNANRNRIVRTVNNKACNPLWGSALFWFGMTFTGLVVYKLYVRVKERGGFLFSDLLFFICMELDFYRPCCLQVFWQSERERKNFVPIPIVVSCKNTPIINVNISDWSKQKILFGGIQKTKWNWILLKKKKYRYYFCNFNKRPFSSSKSRP